MRLLLDENVSCKIIKHINDVFPESTHVTAINPPLRKDLDIWNYAKENKYIVVTFDEDFYEWQLLKGFPPQIIWLRCGNTSTRSLIEKLREKQKEIEQFNRNTNLGMMEIY